VSCAAASPRSVPTAPRHRDHRRIVAAGGAGWRADPSAAIIYQGQQPGGAERTEAPSRRRIRTMGGCMDLSKLSRGDRIVVITGALLVIDLLFLPWISISL